MNKHHLDQSHYIGWKFKLALVLAFLPFISLFAALLVHWPLPTFLLNFLTGERAAYIFFMEHSKENVLGSVAFAISCFAIGLIIVSYIVHDRGSLRIALHDLANTFFHDLFNWAPRGDTPDESTATQPPPPADADTRYEELKTALAKRDQHPYTVHETSP